MLLETFMDSFLDSEMKKMADGGGVVGGALAAVTPSQMGHRWQFFIVAI